MTVVVERGLGYRREVVADARDMHFAAHPASATPISSVSDLDIWSLRAKQQLGTSSCVGNGWAAAAQRAFVLQGVYDTCPELSARWCYRGSLNVDGNNEDTGTFVRSAAKVVKALGFASEGSMPFSEAAVLEQPDAVAERDAFDRRGLRGYHRIPDGDADGVFRALSAGMLVVTGWDVSEHFVNADGHEVFETQRPPLAGGHCMAIVGHGSSDYFAGRVAEFRPTRKYARLARILGSWGGSAPGETYGYNGRIFATPEFVAQATDIWCLDVRGAP